MTAYVEPNTPFSKSRMFSKGDSALVYEPLPNERWIFSLSGVDAKYLETPNVILVTEHPFYSLEVCSHGRGYRDITVNPHVVGGLCGFPTRYGSYAGDPEHDIPIGEQIDSKDPRARYLARVENAGRVGPSARGYCLHGYLTRLIYLSFTPSSECGVVVEAPDGNVPGDGAQ